MKHDDHITIDATAAEIWKYVGHPEMWPEFHEKIVAVDCASPREGEPIELLIQFGKNQVLCEGTITEYSPNASICTELWGRSTGMRGERSVRFTVALKLEPSATGSETLVTERVVYDIELPWFIRILVWWISKFGKPVGQTQLQKLKELVEHSE